jgi:hypothetical protein
MTDRKDSTSDKTADLSDLRKPKRRALGRESIRRTSQMTADSLGGFAEATSQAFRSFSEQLSKAEASSKGLSSGILEGYLAGNAAFFQQLAKTASQALSSVQEWDACVDMARAAEQIDYERLAKLVAEELRRDNKPK